MIYLEWALLAAALGLLTITEQYQPYILIALGLMISSFTVRAIRTRHIFPRTGLEIPAFLFILSAAVATWVAFDRLTAFLQFVRILAALVLYWEISDIWIRGNIRPADLKTPLVHRANFWPARWVSTFFVLGVAGLALYWPLNHNFTSEPVKFNPLNNLGVWLNANLPQVPGPTIHPNVAGGLLALALPIAVFLTWEYWRIRRNRKMGFPAAVISLICSLIISGGLIVTGSRGGILGLLAAGGALILVFIQRQWFGGHKAKLVFWTLVGVILILGASSLILNGNISSILGQLPDPSGALQDRPRVWGLGLPLLGDFFFTGSGLMTFYWIYPVYALLNHVGIFAHIHNFLLEIWIEQGILGATSAIWMVVIFLSWAWRSLDLHLSNETTGSAETLETQTVLGWAGLLSLLVISVHGIVDVVFYVERTLPVLGLAAGLGFFAFFQVKYGDSAITDRSFGYPLPAVVGKSKWKLAILASLVVVAAGLIGVFHRQVISAWYANMGAIRQARIELPAYSKGKFQEQTLDQLRRSVDLQPVIQAYEKALVWNQDNLSALERMIDLKLSLGDISGAGKNARSAWESQSDALFRPQMVWRDIPGGGFYSRHQPGYRLSLLFADSLAANGQIQEAAEVLRNLSPALLPAIENRILYLAYYRYIMDDDLPIAKNFLETVLLINPDNRSASDTLEKLKK